MKIRPFRLTMSVLAIMIPTALMAVIILLALYSFDAIRFNGLAFLFGQHWDLGNLYMDPVKTRGLMVPHGATYGVLVFIVGTLLSSGIAILIAVPVSIGCAIFIAEAVPARFRPYFSMLVELVAVVPSVLIGLWGISVLVPLIAHVIAPGMSAVLGFIPFFSTAGGGGSGLGLLAASLVLALMITPIIATTLLDSLQQVPREIKESAFALGATHFEVVRGAMMPMVRNTLIGGIVLGLGRALGETMAVLMVSGGAINYLPHTIFTPISTIASFIVTQLDSAEQDPTGMAVKSLAEIALVLFIITLIVNGLARLLARRFNNVRSA
ncbi:MAG: phosphate ABC transporter permease subunit PstC [Rhodospirillales bacterium 20-60-12]|nr:MAG: phosphate ABC transporter permease subunit PstC [Rhodospirillales bacterium 20-60-12]HQT67252.1 phosphate ABC transporter permease subunit PstC [Acetobacteraceae bacterium]